ncbi:3-carboxyethylcatechol 2,3-dioxygenase [Aquisediminimonas profunda]|uniref:DODA-type extradiol aromatic ring-opening family dioxygenase n=1 Tax=Aquisediminimonas profunda TaxID=1550733 RepID=UPI001C6346EC|nr:3-carboxyethylcatechol 2,3-dioxygenase [Aquisediminimonas profunda]
MPAELICMGHGGLMNVEALLTPDELAAVKDEIGQARAAVHGFVPDLIIQFGNDHNSGFSLKLMPPFLVALRARTLGDFDTSQKVLAIDEVLARQLVRHLHAEGIDVATSYDALFDHGFTMALDKLFGDREHPPVIPVFTNCGGDLRPPLHRSLALGTAIGQFCASQFSHLNVLFVGSGGLSHDPPLPEFEKSSPSVQQRMIEGVEWTDSSLRERTERVTEAGREHGRGEGALRPLNPEWDREMLAYFGTADLEAVAAQDDLEIVEAGGRGASEIRNWLAAFAALRAYGGHYSVEHEFYRPLPSWITGFAIVHAASKSNEMRTAA